MDSSDCLKIETYPEGHNKDARATTLFCLAAYQPAYVMQKRGVTLAYRVPTLYAGKGTAVGTVVRSQEYSCVSGTGRERTISCDLSRSDYRTVGGTRSHHTAVQYGTQLSALTYCS